MGNWSRYTWCGVVLAALGLAGCGEGGPPKFHLDMRQIVANQIVPEHQREIAAVLRHTFGTPDKPLAPPETGLDLAKLQLAAGPVRTDQEGVKSGLYRRECARCHGITGDGRGPDAMVLNPYPRDYRPGVFKFKSTYSADRPTDDDLRDVLIDGIPGTSMPAFSLLKPAEIDALVEYVKYLSMRGELETVLVGYVADELDFDPASGTTDQPLDPEHNPEQQRAIRAMLADDVAAPWKVATEEVVVPSPGAMPPKDRSPEEIAQSIKLGRELFVSKRADCIKCHGATGRGNYEQADQNMWNEANLKFIDDTKTLAKHVASLRERMGKLSGDQLAAARRELAEQTNELAERRQVIETLLPPRRDIPRNLQLGVYRGGRRPLDLYRRIHQGIPGTPMPAVGPAGPGAQGTLTDKEIWHLVDYVRSLPFEPGGGAQASSAGTDAAVN